MLKRRNGDRNGIVSFDPDVVETDGRVAAAEAASGGVNWAFSPMIDVSRDSRWGRVAEGFGEDVFLTAQFGAAKVRGFQAVDWLIAVR